MRADDVSTVSPPTAVSAPSAGRVEPSVPAPHTAPAWDHESVLAETELELRRAAKTFLRRKVPTAPLLRKKPATAGRVAFDSFEATGLEGWMIGSNLCLLADGGWVPYVAGRSQKLDRPRTGMFADAGTKKAAAEWDALNDAGVAPGARYIAIEPEHANYLDVCRHPRRGELFKVRVIAGLPHLVFPYDRGQGSHEDVLRDDLHRWTADYLG